MGTKSANAGVSRAPHKAWMAANKDRMAAVRMGLPAYVPPAPTQPEVTRARRALAKQASAPLSDDPVEDAYLLRTLTNIAEKKQPGLRAGRALDLYDAGAIDYPTLFWSLSRSEGRVVERDRDRSALEGQRAVAWVRRAPNAASWGPEHQLRLVELAAAELRLASIETTYAEALSVAHAGKKRGPHHGVRRLTTDIDALRSAWLNRSFDVVLVAGLGRLTHQDHLRDYLRYLAADRIPVMFLFEDLLTQHDAGWEERLEGLLTEYDERRAALRKW